MNGNPIIPLPVNEPVLTYAPGTRERAELKAELDAQSSIVVDIPLVIGGQEIRTGNTTNIVMPHKHSHVLGTTHQAGTEEIGQAIEAATAAHQEWSTTRWEDRAAIFMRAADLLAGPWRQKLNAATMLGQSKTVFQAEVDSACEIVDFFRFAAHFAERIYEMQPLSERGVWNRAEYRSLEGFIYAITPFNFTAIGANLSGIPAMMGNSVVWKPGSTSMLSNYYVLKLLEEAGLPAGVINFIGGDAGLITSELLARKELAGIHFTGSTAVFNSLWETVGGNIGGYASYPRIVGETGGKDFIIAHPSADIGALKTAIIRGAFEYQGQKCSAASRAYIPASLWKDLEGPLVEETESITIGDPRDFTNFMNAVIDQKAYDKITSYIDGAKKSEDAEVIAGGDYDDSEGWFIKPTIIQARRPDYVSMCDEIFGPVISVFVYDDTDWERTLELVDSTSPYALTGAVFANDRSAIREAMDALRNSAGNFYINDKPTGAVVGQQPFGGGRASGTNDKAGSMMNLLRWVSARSIKETFVPAQNYRYPFMESE